MPSLAVGAIFGALGSGSKDSGVLRLSEIYGFRGLGLKTSELGPGLDFRVNPKTYTLNPES